MTSTERLFVAQFPRSNAYHPDWVLESAGRGAQRFVASRSAAPREPRVREGRREPVYERREALSIDTGGCAALPLTSFGVVPWGAFNDASQRCEPHPRAKTNALGDHRELNLETDGTPLLSSHA